LLFETEFCIKIYFLIKVLKEFNFLRKYFYLFIFLNEKQKNFINNYKLNFIECMSYKSILTEKSVEIESYIP